MKKEVIAMLLAGGQGSRLGELTRKNAKPAVTFGGKYKIIDFSMSNCINSGIDTVGVLTQYQPLLLNKHIGIGIPWDLDRRSGGVTVLTPHLKGESGEWFTGTANAIFQHMAYIDSYNPEYILVISGDHVYKMDYSPMINFHKKNNADATIGVMQVSYEEAKSFGTLVCDENFKINLFEEKPPEPKSTLVSMGVYVFTWSVLKDALIKDHTIHADSDFGKHIIPNLLDEKCDLYAFTFDSYWKDVGTIDSYFSANMDLIKTIPDFNLYETFWSIYTDGDNYAPSYCSTESDVRSSLISEGCEIEGTIHNSVLSPGVLVESGAIVRDSIIMKNCVIKKGSFVEGCILDEGVIVGEGARLGLGENIPSKHNPKVYYSGITVIGENTTIPPNITVGKNCVISGATTPEDYKSGLLDSGEYLIKEEVAP
ncbi:MAG: glucose-1-phosphate adenylyltransferase [Defluviitaleaceae bacterium]|nr:glucose-1-phosphate adenylyltransferase [Defluviitaleaceae bacterium]